MNAKQTNTRKLIYRICLLVIALIALQTPASALENFTNLTAKVNKAFAKEQYNQAIEYENEAIQLDTNNPVGYEDRGWIYARSKFFDKASMDFNKAIELSTNSAQLSLAHFWRGVSYAGITNNEKALDDFNEAIHKNPMASGPYLARASVYISKGDYDLAIFDCDMAIWANSKNWQAYFYKGAALLEQKNYDKAIEALNNALKYNRDFPTSYFDRGIALSKTGDNTNALADFDRLIHLDSKNSTGYTDRGLTYSRLGDFRKGLKDCWHAVQLDPNNDMACNNLAWLLTTAPESKLRDGKKAVKYAERACELSKWKNAYYLGTLAAALAETGRFDEAIKWEQECIKLGLETEKEMLQAQKELELFKQSKPYHAEKKFESQFPSL